MTKPTVVLRIRVVPPDAIWDLKALTVNAASLLDPTDDHRYVGTRHFDVPAEVLPTGNLNTIIHVWAVLTSASKNFGVNLEGSSSAFLDPSPPPDAAKFLVMKSASAKDADLNGEITLKASLDVFHLASNAPPIHMGEQ